MEGIVEEILRSQEMTSPLKKIQSEIEEMQKDEYALFNKIHQIEVDFLSETLYPSFSFQENITKLKEKAIELETEIQNKTSLFKALDEVISLSFLKAEIFTGSQSIQNSGFKTEHQQGRLYQNAQRKVKHSFWLKEICV